MLRRPPDGLLNDSSQLRALQPKQGQQRWGTLVAAVRLGERASIGVCSWTSAHGGAVESVLDEATAELAKMEWATMVSTIEVLPPPDLPRPSDGHDAGSGSYM